MAKKGRLLLALDAHKGRDYAAEKRMKQVKAAEKRKRQKQQSLKQADDANSDENRPEEQDQPPAEPMVNLADKDFASFSADEDDDGEENGVLLEAEIQQSGLHTQPSPSHSDSESNHDADVPFSDLSEEDRTDIVPHHRQTINNGPAIIASTKSVTIAKPEMPFSAHNSLVSLLPALATSVPDPNDDLTRELEFYRIAQDAAVSARELLLEAGIPFSRPNDYFAEMVKTDEHMGKVRKKMYDEAAAKKASSEAKAQRQAKKFGKQVQRAKEEERARTRRETLDKIKDLKRSKFTHLILLCLNLLPSCVANAIGNFRPFPGDKNVIDLGGPLPVIYRTQRSRYGPDQRTRRAVRIHRRRGPASQGPFGS